MEDIFELIPTLITAAFCMILLLIVSGTKYSIKKTILIVVPITLLILIINALVFDLNNYEKVSIWNVISIFTPEAILIFFIAKRKRLSLFTGIINAFLTVFFLSLIELVGLNFIDNDYIFRLISYLVIYPIAAAYLYFFYNRLHNIVEENLPKMFWLLLLYGIAMFAEIWLYQNIIHTTSQNILKINIFSLALLSVYLISITGFYLFLQKYQDEITNNYDDRILHKQIDNIMEIYELKEKNENELRVLRHDMKHILVSISTLINNNQLDEAKQIINSYNIAVENTKQKKFCTNLIINAVLEYYNQQCINNKINFKTKINDFEGLLNIPINEIIVVISNCLDNAINASIKIPRNRYINFIFINNNDRLIMQIKNKFDGNITLDLNNMPTNEHEKHGFGTKSIELFAKRHNITLDYNITKTTFEITFLFNTISKK